MKIKNHLGNNTKFDLHFNRLNFEEIQEVLYIDVKYFQFVKIDHPDYSKITEFYEFLKK